MSDAPDWLLGAWRRLLPRAVPVIGGNTFRASELRAMFGR